MIIFCQGLTWLKVSKKTTWFVVRFDIIQVTFKYIYLKVTCMMSNLTTNQVVFLETFNQVNPWQNMIINNYYKYYSIC